MTPRRLAVKALIHQEQAGYANLVLDAELKKCTPPLDSRDAAFAARIFYTTLERLPLLDYRINQFTKKPVAKLDIHKDQIGIRLLLKPAYGLFDSLRNSRNPYRRVQLLQHLRCHRKELQHRHISH